MLSKTIRPNKKLINLAMVSRRVVRVVQNILTHIIDKFMHGNDPGLLRHTFNMVDKLTKRVNVGAPCDRDLLNPVSGMQTHDRANCGNRKYQR